MRSVSSGMAITDPSIPSSLVGGMNGMFVDIMPGDTEFIGTKAKMSATNMRPLPGVIRGILQDDVSIAFTSTYKDVDMVDLASKNVSGMIGAAADIFGGSKTPQGRIIGAVSELAGAGVGGDNSRASDFASVVGLGWGGSGPASTKGYQKSSIAGFTVNLKWYMPGAEIEVSKNLLLAIYASQPTEISLEDSIDNTMKTITSAGEGGVKRSLATMITGALRLPDAAQMMLTEFSALYRAPPVLKVRISDWLTVSPVVCTKTDVNMTRVTYDYNDGGTIRQLPVFITIKMEFAPLQGQLLGGTYYKGVNNAEALSILGIQLAGSSPFNFKGLEQ